MEANNGFFGNIQGPFAANEELFDKIQENCINTISYISKIGIHYEGSYDLDIQGKFTQQIIICINDIEFVLGRTRILELENCKITSLKLKTNVDSHFFIDYQYQSK